MLAVKERPDLFHAYVGVGQVAHLARSEPIAYRWALAEAEKRGEEEAMAELRAIGPPPYGAAEIDKKMVEVKWVAEFGGGPMHDTDGMLSLMASAMLNTREYTLTDKLSYFLGNLRTVELMWDEIMAIDLFEVAPELEVPVYVLQGKYDYQVSTPLTEQYVEALRAPIKKYYVFEHSAHGTIFEEPEKFHRIMVEEVLGGGANAREPKKRDVRLRVGPGEIYFHVQTFDPGEPYLLYLNGGPGDVSVRARALFETIGFERNIIYLDQRGCGRSDRDVPREAFRFANLVADIDAVLDELELERVVVLGHSWGAVYGVKYALARPERVLGLIAISPVDSWQRALDRYYVAAPAHARRSIALLNRLAAEPRALSDADRLEVLSFCGFMAKSHGEDEQRAAYEACRRDPAEADTTAMIAELEVDLASIEELAAQENRWRGWSARGIRKKYGLYAYSPDCDSSCQAANQLVETLYSPAELEYSTVMEGGLHVNDGWESYDLLRELPSLKPPFFYLYGAHDQLFGSPEIASWVAEQLGPSHVIRFEHAGHSPMMESPVAFKREARRLVELLVGK